MMTLKELHLFLAEQTTHMKFNLSPSTEVDYARVWRAAGTDYPTYLRSAPTSTFGKRKCAILWRLRFLLTETLTDIDDANRLGEVNQNWRLQQANLCADLIVQVTAIERKHSRTQVGKSKKRGLKILSKDGDFRIRLAAAAGKAGQVAILVLAIAGIRPAEMEKGVLLKIVGEHEFDVNIGGVKYTKTTGHEFRGQRHDIRLSDLAAKLFAAIKKAGGMLQLKRSTGALRDDVKAAAKRAKMPLTISPYSLRHQFAADLKAAGWSPVDVARAMGHSSTRTGGRYGRKKSGSAGTSSMVKVWASGMVQEPVRPLPNKAVATKKDVPSLDFEV